MRSPKNFGGESTISAGMASPPAHLAVFQGGGRCLGAVENALMNEVSRQQMKEKGTFPPWGLSFSPQTRFTFTPPLRGSQRGKDNVRSRVGGGSFYFRIVPHRIGLRTNRSASSTPPQGGSESLLSSRLTMLFRKKFSAAQVGGVISSEIRFFNAPRAIRRARGASRRARR